MNFLLFKLSGDLSNLCCDTFCMKYKKSKFSRIHVLCAFESCCECVDDLNWIRAKHLVSTLYVISWTHSWWTYIYTYMFETWQHRANISTWISHILTWAVFVYNILICTHIYALAFCFSLTHYQIKMHDDCVQCEGRKTKYRMCEWKQNLSREMK